MGLFASSSRIGSTFCQNAVKIGEVVILGGGFGGLNTALALERLCGQRLSCRITLVDRVSEHLYTPLLYEVASGFLVEPVRTCPGRLRQGVCVGFEEFRTIIGSRHINFLAGEVAGLDQKERQVILTDGRRLNYDVLVVALGSETNFFEVAGAAELTLPLKTLLDAFRVRARLHDFLEFYRAGKEERITLTVVGAGATGVELSCEIGNFFSRLSRVGVLRNGDWSVRLIEAGPEILRGFSAKARQEAGRRLEQLGVEVMTSTRVSAVEKGAIILTAKERPPDRFEADVIVWCGGIRPNRAVSLLGLPLTSDGRLKVGANLRVDSQLPIFALGDAAAVALPADRIAPPLAQVAVEQARLTAQNIIRMKNSQPLQSWAGRLKWPAVIPLGGRRAVAEFGPLCLRGLGAYLLRKAADARYLFSILPPRYAFRVWWQGAKTYLQND